MIWKSDQETSIMMLKERARRELGSSYNIKMEESAVKDHQENGTIEQAVQRLKGQFKVLRMALESRIGRKIRESEDVIPWLIHHARVVVNKYQVGKDGKTAYERLVERKCTRRWLSLGRES